MTHDNRDDTPEAEEQTKQRYRAGGTGSTWFLGGVLLIFIVFGTLWVISIAGPIVNEGLDGDRGTGINTILPKEAEDSASATRIEAGASSLPKGVRAASAPLD